MKIKKVYCKHLPFKGYTAMSVYPWIIIRKDNKKKYTPTANRHTQIHLLQQLETAWIFFFVFYALEYIFKLVLTMSHYRAYKSVSFEQEANNHQGHINYISDRKHFEWIQYIFKLTKKLSYKFLL